MESVSLVGHVWVFVQVEHSENKPQLQSPKNNCPHLLVVAKSDGGEKIKGINL